MLGFSHNRWVRQEAHFYSSAWNEEIDQAASFERRNVSND